MTSIYDNLSESKGAKPEPAPVAVENIPEAIRQSTSCVVWKLVRDEDPETGEVNWDKPPFNARTGGLASSTNPATWSTFAEAEAAYRRGGWDGIGLVLHRKHGEEEAEGLVAIDLDHCRNPENGEIEQWAQDIIHKLNSYTEVSSSGRGLRIFVRGYLPRRGRKKGPFEVYQTGRYVTVTGQHVAETPRTIECRQAELWEIHRQVFGEQQDGARAGSSGPSASLNLLDSEIVAKASRAKNGAKFRQLWEGNISGHRSRSEADLALCNHLAFWCGPHEERIAELFAQSGLYRSKWQREDYRQRTLEMALAGRTVYYEPRRRPSANGTHHSNGTHDPHEFVNGESAQTDESDARPGAPNEADSDEAHLTDRGNAIRLVLRHGRDLHYCHPWKKWLVWDGRRWAEDETGAAARMAKETVVALFRWASDQIEEIASQLEEEASRG